MSGQLPSHPFPALDEFLDFAAFLRLVFSSFPPSFEIIGDGPVFCFGHFPRWQLILK